MREWMVIKLQIYGRNTKMEFRLIDSMQNFVSQLQRKMIQSIE